MVTNLKERNYKDRLAELGMLTLEERRRRGDMIEVYKVISGKEDVNYQTWFELANTRDGAPSTRATA